VKVDIIIGSPINSSSAYVLDEFLKNQKEIHKHIRAITVFATEDKKFYKKMKQSLPKGFKIFYFSPIKGKRDRVWNIVKARNTIREFFLRTKVKYLCFMDADMIFEPDIINKLIKKAEEGYDVIYNLYRLKNGEIAYSGFGGTLIRRWVLKKVKFRCTERNNLVIDEITFFKKDLLNIKARIFRGFLGYSAHIDRNGKKWEAWPRKLSFKEKMSLFLADFLLFYTPGIEYSIGMFLKLRDLGRTMFRLT